MGHARDLSETRKRLLEAKVLGPWLDEPDRLDFEASGFPAFILRNQLMVWCGYVGIPDSHSLYKRSYLDVDLSVHGGLTYSDACSGDICHTPKAGEADNVWWFGFDCGHFSDYVPTLEAASAYVNLPYSPSSRYKDQTFARAECERLAQQLRKIAEQS